MLCDRHGNTLDTDDKRACLGRDCHHGSGPARRATGDPGMRITVGDVLGWLASGMSEAEILEDFPELTQADIPAALAFAAERERSTHVAGE